MSTFWGEKHTKYYFKKTSIRLTENTFMSNKYVKLEVDSFKIGKEIRSNTLKNVILRTTR